MRVVGWVGLMAVLLGCQAGPGPPARPTCAASYPRACQACAPAVIDWAYPEGTVLHAGASIELDGDGRPDALRVRARVERNFSRDVVSGERSAAPECWFDVDLVVTAADGMPLYVDRWAVRFADAGPLFDSLDAVSPEDYFARVASLAQHFADPLTGAGVRPRPPVVPHPNIIAWSLERQGLTGPAPHAVLADLAEQPELRTVVYRARRRDDFRIAAYSPLLGRAVVVRLGDGWR